MASGEVPVTNPRPRLLAIFAHPDDESFGPGATLARYASEGVEITLITATRGEMSTMGRSQEHGVEALGAVRETELGCAARVLGVKHVRILGYPDTRLHDVDEGELQRLLRRAMVEVRPHVVLTFHPGGITGNPDHMVITSATSRAFSDLYRLHPQQRAPESKLYYWTIPNSIATALRQISDIDFVGSPDDAITTIIDVRQYLEIQERAIRCHRSQSDPLPLVLCRRVEAQAGREYFVLAGRRAEAKVMEETFF